MPDYDFTHIGNDLDSRAASRQQQHSFAKSLLLDGKFSDAIKVMQSARQQYGDHISLYADIATCYYLDGRMIEWKNFLDKTADTYVSVERFLSRETRLSATLLLGKFREEEARVDQALKQYDALLETLDIETESEYYALCLAQILRISVQFGLKRPIAEYYNTLMQLVHIEQNEDDRVDILHAVMLAELEVIGPQAAINRLRSILDLEDLPEAEASLAYFDLLESFLRAKPMHLPAEMAELAKRVKPRDTYERTLECMAFQPDLVNSRLNFAPGLSTADSLRLHSLLFFFETSTEYQIELRRKIAFILEGLGPDSTAIWRHYLRHTLQDESVDLALCIRREILSVGNCELSLARKRNMQKLLASMDGVQELTLEEVARRVWDANYNESYYHRLRMLARRMNDLLYTNFGVEKAILVDSEKVALNSKITISVTNIR